MPESSNKNGYVNGSDLLVCIKEGTGQQVTRKAVGHCTTHTATFNTETKDVAVKPPMANGVSAKALFKKKRITGLSVQVQCSGLCFYEESEGGVKVILSKWKVGQSVELELFERPDADNGSPTPYCSGAFVITSLVNTAPAGEDATYDATFDNDGDVSVDTEQLT